MGAAAQLERGMIRARMQAGRRRARANGRHIGGSAPYGFAIAGDGKLESVSKLLGHANTSITERAYASLLDSTIRAEVFAALGAAG